MSKTDPNNKGFCADCGAPLAKTAMGSLCPKCLLKAGMRTTPLLAKATVAQVSKGLPLPGESLGHYKILGTLGQGGMGAVFEALDTENGRRVALKVLSQALDSPEARERFFREGRLAASINHPNSVYVFGTEEIGGTPVIAMELMAGGTLEDRVRTLGPLSAAEAVDAIRQVISGLEAAQKTGILHRDIKPSNCFVSGKTIKIGDFGLSISTSVRTEPALTASGLFLGTPAFCSPEQLRGEVLTAHSDMYSVGATLYFLLTGKPPFESGNVVQMLATILEQPVVSPRKLRPSVPEGLARVVLRCLDKQPERRFRSYAELARALTPYSSSSPNPATLGLRFCAGALDGIALGLLGTAIFWALMGTPLEILEMGAIHSAYALPFMGGWITTMLLYYSVSEHRYGATPGKFICGLRVIGPGKSPPKFGAALVRAAVYCVIPVLPSALTYAIGGLAVYTEPSMWQMLSGFSFYILIGLLFSTARRRNGFAAVHDLLTRTRVVSRVALASRPALEYAETPPLELAGNPMIGPYHLLREMESGPDADWVLGYDLRLLRKVWVRRVPLGTSPFPAFLRNVGRPGRLRWLTGHRSATENWDAFEALTGKAFLELIQQPQKWERVRFWLQDLAVELNAAARDETLPGILELNRIWIDGEGRAKLLDVDAPGTRHLKIGLATSGSAPAMHEPQSAAAIVFLRKVAVTALAGNSANAGTPSDLAMPLPLSVRSFLDNIFSLASPERVLAALSPLLSRSARVSRPRRLALVLGCAAFPIFAGTMATFGTMLFQRWHEASPQLMELSQVLQYRSNLRFWAKPHQGPSDEQFAVYIAAKFAPVVTNQALWSGTLGRSLVKRESRQFAERAVREHAGITEAEALEVEKAVGSKLPPTSGMDFLRQPWVPWFVASSTLVVYVAIPALIAALAFRGGLVQRIGSVAFVRRDGRVASRFRVFLRAIVAWSILPIGLCAFLVYQPLIGTTVSAVLAWAVMTVIAGLSIALPKRGLQDRIAGTWPVLR